MDGLTNKLTLAERIKKRLEGGSLNRDALGKLDSRVLFIEIDTEYADAIRQLYLLYRQQFDDNDFLLSFLSVYVQPVEYDEKKKKFYSVIPAKYVTLPEGRGLWNIYLPEDEAKVFIPHWNEFLYSGQESEGIEGRIGYKIKGTKVYFSPKLSSIKSPCEVVFELVAATSGMEAGEDFPITADVEKMIIDTICQRYDPVMRTSQDKVADQNDQR